MFHAVSASLRALLGDWMMLVTQLEHGLRQGAINMQAMAFHCQVRGMRWRCPLTRQDLSAPLR